MSINHRIVLFILSIMFTTHRCIGGSPIFNRNLPIIKVIFPVTKNISLSIRNALWITRYFIYLCLLFRRVTKIHESTSSATNISRMLFLGDRSTNV